MFQPLGHFPARPDRAAHVDTQTNINGAGPGNGQLLLLVPQSQDGSFSREMDFTTMMNQQPGENSPLLDPCCFLVPLVALWFIPFRSWSKLPAFDGVGFGALWRLTPLPAILY
ncbi:hypothetical protein PAXRUDRAFT_828406, partial [Paxillus rubicundulus Ve08.2h10]